MAKRTKSRPVAVEVDLTVEREEALCNDSSAQLIVTCRHCGSRNIGHGQGYIVQSRVSSFYVDGHGELQVNSFCGTDKVDFDADIGDSMFSCLECGKEYVDGIEENVKVEWLPAGAVTPLSGENAESLRDCARLLVAALSAEYPRSSLSKEINEHLDHLRCAIGWRDGETREHFKKRWIVTRKKRSGKPAPKPLVVLAETAEEVRNALSRADIASADIRAED